MFRGEQRARKMDWNLGTMTHVLRQPHVHAQPHTRITGMGEMPTCTQRHPGRNVGIDLPIRPPTRKQTICISRRRTTIPISFFVLRFSITTPAIVKLQPISDTLITIIWTVRIWKLWEYIPEISKDDFFQSRLLDRVLRMHQIWLKALYENVRLTTSMHIRRRSLFW